MLQPQQTSENSNDLAKFLTISYHTYSFCSLYSKTKDYHSVVGEPGNKPQLLLLSFIYTYSVLVCISIGAQYKTLMYLTTIAVAMCMVYNFQIQQQEVLLLGLQVAIPSLPLILSLCSYDCACLPFLLFKVDLLEPRNTIFLDVSFGKRERKICRDPSGNRTWDLPITSRMLLPLIHWTHTRGAEASLLYRQAVYACD